LEVTKLTIKAPERTHLAVQPLDLYAEDLKMEELPPANQIFCSSANLGTVASISSGIGGATGSCLSSWSSLSSSC
jgi:hypothetical protein